MIQGSRKTFVDAKERANSVVIMSVFQQPPVYVARKSSARTSLALPLP